jgi:GTP-binding protein EngB required for normal cell division
MDERAIDLVIALAQQTTRSLRTGAIGIPSAVRHRIDPEAIAQMLADFQQHRLLPLLHRWEVAEEAPYVLALVGLSNVGKSTILQALFQARLSPAANRPTTAFPIWFRHAPSWRVEIARTGARIERQQPDSTEATQALMERSASLTSKDSVGVEWARVSGPIALLEGGLEVVDTPGFGAAQVGDEEGTHASSLDEFLSTRVHQVFFCVAVSKETSNVTPEEARYYEKLRNSCGHIVVNKWRGSDEEKSQYRAKFQGMFPNASFLFTRAKANVEQSEGEDIAELIREVEAAKDPAARTLACERELVDALLDLHEHHKQHFGLDQIPWSTHELERLMFHTVESSPLSPCIQKLTRSLP